MYREWIPGGALAVRDDTAPLICVGRRSASQKEQARMMQYPPTDQALKQQSNSWHWTATRWVIVTVLVGVLSCGPTGPRADAQAPTQPPTMSSVAGLLKSGSLDEAQKIVTEYDDAVISKRLSDVDTTIMLAQVARALENAGDDKAASDVYLRACAATRRSASSSLTPQQSAMIQLAAGSTLVRAGKTKQAVDTLADALASGPTASPAIVLNAPHPDSITKHALSERQRASAGQLLMLLGSEALSSGKSELAEKAYASALPHVSGETAATVMLGHGWAISLQAGRDKDAAEALTTFVEKHPNHSDVASAAGLCIERLKASGQPGAAEAMTSRLLTRWPQTPAAANLIKQYAASDIREMPQSAKTWLLGRAMPDRIETLDATTAAAALLVAIDQQQPDQADILLAHLAATDQSGQAVSDVLQRLTTGDRAADAEQLASRLLAPGKSESENQITLMTAAAREAACRWAGRRQLWSMLTMASESSRVEDDDPTRTITVERLFAESLMQSGRPEEAGVWWNHLIDSRGVSDFATLLRCAESATAYADLPIADNRIADARRAAGDATNKLTLVEMLSAELAVRELKFDQARSALEHVVRSEGAIAALRGRAQWTIGETYYLQEKFADAIEAYRKVEGIDPDGNWIAASLVQAGKSFEQLGRTREAAVCYSTLVSRFTESPHATSARRRLAAIDPSSAPTTDTLRR